MNILGNNTSKLNAIIFENRNKSYGAFEIRESYNDSLKKSLLCLAGFVGIVFGSVFIYNKVTAIPSDTKAITFNDPTLDPIYVETQVDLTPITEPVQNEAAAAPQGGMPQHIVDNATPTLSVNIDHPVGGLGSQDANGLSTTSTSESTVAVVASTPSVALVIPTEIVIIAEEMPEFEGGQNGLMTYVAKSVVYPEIAKEAGKQGIVYVSFVVNETGNVEGAKVLKGIGLGCDEEVLRVINKMPRWKKVGKNAGHPVKVRFNIPVSFKLK